MLHKPVVSVNPAYCSVYNKCCFSRSKEVTAGGKRRLVHCSDVLDGRPFLSAPQPSTGPLLDEVLVLMPSAPEL